MEQPTITPPLPSPPGEAAGNCEIILVIPTHNDELTLGSVIVKAKPLVSRIIVVDDGSKDRTSEVGHIAGVEVIRFQQGVGKGAAIFEGLRRAHYSGCKIAIVMDGDARYKTREIPWIIANIVQGSADVVIGSRYLEVEGDISIRQLITQKIVPVPGPGEKQVKITDPLSGFFAFNANALKNLDFSFSNNNFKEKLWEHCINNHLEIQEIAVSERSYLGKKFGWDECIKTAVALPAYNEELYIAKVILGAQPYVDIVIVVDDGSTDATCTIAQNMGALVIRHEKNLGYGGALQTIFNVSRDMNLEAVVILDSDGQHNPEDIPKVLAPLLEGADVVIGSRFLDPKKNSIPSYRKVGMKVLDTATAVAGVKNVSDTQSGFRAYGKKAINTINLSGTGMSAGSEILIQVSDANLTVVEVPIHVRYDIPNTSSQNPVSHGLSVLYRIINLISYRRPLVAFGIPGFVLVIAGLIASFVAFTEYYDTSKFPFALSMVSMLFLILGLLLGIAGLILNALIVIVKVDSSKK